MQNKMQNLFNKEEWIILNLQNAGYQVKTYLKQLNELVEKYEVADLKEQVTWFKKIFNYYKKDLIPAIQETVVLENRHINNSITLKKVI